MMTPAERRHIERRLEDPRYVATDEGQRALDALWAEQRRERAEARRVARKVTR